MPNIYLMALPFMKFGNSPRLLKMQPPTQFAMLCNGWVGWLANFCLDIFVYCMHAYWTYAAAAATTTPL